MELEGVRLAEDRDGVEEERDGVDEERDRLEAVGGRGGVRPEGGDGAAGAVQKTNGLGDDGGGESFQQVQDSGPDAQQR